MPPALSSPVRPLARWRRAFFWGAVALLLLELVYIAMLVTGGLATLLNHLIPDTRMGWQRARSVVPGRIALEGFHLRREEKHGGHWELNIERAEVNVSLTALFRQRFQTLSLDVQGLHARIHSVTPEQEGEVPEAAPAPEASPAPAPAPAEQQKENEPGGWKILLHDVRVDGVKELRWNKIRLTGLERVEGGLNVEPGERIHLHETRLRLGPGELFVEEQPVAHVEKGELSATLQARYRGAEGIDLIAGLTGGRLRLSATVPEISTLQQLLPHVEGVKPEGGAGRVEVDVRVEDGRLAPGTRLEGHGEPFLLPVGPLRLKAPWRFLAEVGPQEGEDRLTLAVTLGPVRLERASGSAQALETPEVVVLLSALAPRLGEPLPDVHVALRSSRSKPLDLRVLNGWLGASFQVEAGQAVLEASSHGDMQKRDGEGHLSLSTQGLRTLWGGARLAGRVSMDIDARKLGLTRDTMILHGSRLLLRGVTVNTGRDFERDWDGTLVFPEATLRLSPPSFRGRFTGGFSNAAPFVALLSHQGVFPHFLSPLLKAEGLRISGVVAMGEQGMKFDALRAQGEGLDVRGRAQSIAGATQADLLVKLGILQVGVEVTPGGTSLHVMRPERWYTQKTGEAVK